MPPVINLLIFFFWQIDPSERLDPEVEDILVDIADEFVESVSGWDSILDF